jgi:hypothetical protein
VVNATPISLNKGEYTLSLAFLDAPQRWFSREHLLHCSTVGIFGIRTSRAVNAAILLFLTQGAPHNHACALVSVSTSPTLSCPPASIRRVVRHVRGAPVMTVPRTQKSISLTIYLFRINVVTWQQYSCINYMEHVGNTLRLPSKEV